MMFWCLWLIESIQSIQLCMVSKSPYHAINPSPPAEPAPDSQAPDILYPGCDASSGIAFSQRLTLSHCSSLWARVGLGMGTYLQLCQPVGKWIRCLKMSPHLSSPRDSSSHSHCVLEHLSTHPAAVRMLTKLRGVPFLEELGVLSAP